MSKKYLIISIVSLIVIAGGIGLYYLLGVEEEMGVMPPPIPDPVIQKVETNTGGSEVVSGEIGTNKIYNSFVVEGENVYWIDRNFPDTKNIIIGADAKTFELLNECKYEICYAKDKSRVFLLSEIMRVVSLEIIGEANPNTFRILTYNYSRDENNFFCNWNKISGIDIAAFRAIGYGFTDNKSVYWGCNKLEGIDDPKSLVFTENSNDGILQDQNFIYHIIPIGPEETKVEKLPKNILFFPSQISEILTKIDENTKKQKEIRKSATGVFVQGDYRAEYLGSKDNTDDKIKIIINGKESIYPLPYNEGNKKCKPDDKDCVSQSKLINLFGFSPDGKYLSYKICGYGYCSLFIVKTIDLSTYNLYEKNTITWLGDDTILIFESTRGPEGRFQSYNIASSLEKPLYSTLGEIETLHGYYFDKDYLYVRASIFNNDSGEILKIYNLNTLKEVYSQEIQ